VTEGRLIKILNKVIWNEPPNLQQGAKLQWGTQIQQCIEKILCGAWTEDRLQFETVFMLSEVGCPLELGHDLSGDKAGNGHREPRPRTLIILGGVRDVSEEEDDAISRACNALQIRRHPVSLGLVSELTSKCIKHIESADRLGFLSGGLHHCRAQGWQVCDAIDIAMRRGRSPLHIVYELGEDLDVFAQRPEAAGMLVDVFRGSHHNYDNTTLSIVEPTGMFLNLRRGNFGCILKQKDALGALDFIRYHTKQRGTLKEVLVREQQLVAQRQKKSRGS
jgi:hypothetical protein